MINGIINIYKTPGFTSHDVVAKMRGICGQKKIGHTGTLDPQATGVLPVCLGSATKVCDMLTDRDKEYVAELLLGVKTDTQDTTGCVLETSIVGGETFSVERITEAIMGFMGSYEQLPPMYSAVKVNGKKLYELAREGREVERRTRTVTIHDLEILEIHLPVVKFRVECSKGTYIRTLCADIGEKLSCGGAMQSLVRTKAGGFLLEDAITLDELQKLKDAGRLKEAVMPVDSVFSVYPALHVSGEGRKLLENGNPFMPEQTLEGEVFAAGQWVRIYREDNSFAAIYAYDAPQRCYKPVKMFLG
ncbi:MAG: tRNA pseudouridine(55) synthase TruB [Bacteroidales bacterium]|nr:tRNA pseudouridine(55) synthase TruB [Lachnoclostridium sp.]MCM1383606.1 tRNA pseudouridine(55) synthase TruB [Lachnoclostridium sp.]MCM1466392.1 tRNA pseudouridine(55) synthase TruB [Bacteroidales bacterium]